MKILPTSEVSSLLDPQCFFSSLNSYDVSIFYSLMKRVSSEICQDCFLLQPMPIPCQQNKIELKRECWLKRLKVIVKVLCMMNTFCQFHYHKSVSCSCALVYVLASCSVILGYMHAFILQILAEHLPQAQNSALLGLSSPI